MNFHFATSPSFDHNVIIISIGAIFLKLKNNIVLFNYKYNVFIIYILCII